jgi:hypothetical protein
MKLACCQFYADFYLGLFVDPEDGVMYASEILVDFQWNRRLYILEDRTLCNRRCKNLKYYVDLLLSYNISDVQTWDEIWEP